MKIRNLIYYFSVLFVFILLVGCNSKEVDINGIKSKYENKLIEEHEINDRYTLISVMEEEIPSYILYDIKEKVEYIIPTDVNEVILDEIIDDSEIVFESTGKNIMNSYQEVPFKQRFIRKGKEFKSFREEIDYDIRCELMIDEGKEGALIDLIQTSEGIEAVFGPISGKEDMFYAAYIDIPPVKTYFKNEKFIIEFSDCLIDNNLLENKIELNHANTYIDDITIEYNDEEKKLSISLALKEGVEKYKIKKERTLNDEVPFLKLNFL